MNNAAPVLSSASAASSPVRFPYGRWNPKGNPVFGSSRTSDSKPIQGELSLDAVRVVCNDLNDSDLELVPVTPMAASARGAEQLSEHGFTPMWTRLASRLFGAGRA